MINASLYHEGLSACSKQGSDAHTVCIRSIIFFMLVVATLFACVYKIYRIHCGIRIEPLHLLVFYLAALECLMFAMEWSFVHRVDLHFAGLYLMVNQFLLICVFYGSLMLKVQRRGRLINRLLYPLAGLLAAYFTFVFVFALVDLHPNSKECKRPAWLLFSASILMLAQFFLFAGMFLTKQMNKVMTAHSYKRWKQRSLWSLILVFELSALALFSGDLALKVDAKNGGCDGLFGGVATASFSAYQVSQRLVGLLLPIWTMIILLRPAARPTPHGARQPIVHESVRRGTGGSVFSRTTGPMSFEDYDISFDDGPFQERANSLVDPLISSTREPYYYDHNDSHYDG